MTSTEIERLVEAWLTYQRNWWSYGALAELSASNPEDAWLVLLRIIALAEDDEMLQTVGAGPLEELLKGHGSTLVASVEAESANNAKLRTALASVWLPRSHDPVTARLVALGCDLIGEQPPEHLRKAVSLLQDLLREGSLKRDGGDDA